MYPNVRAHPEWRVLFEQLADRLEPGQFLPYEELKRIAGIDIRTTRGRQQFFRFAKELLEQKQLHLENQRNEGYTVAYPSQHAKCSQKQIRKGQRRMRHALAIATEVRTEQLGPMEMRVLTDVQERLSRMLFSFSGEVKAIKAEITALERRRLPNPLEQQKEEPPKENS